MFHESRKIEKLVSRERKNIEEKVQTNVKKNSADVGSVNDLIGY